MNNEVIRKLVEDRLEELDRERDELKQALSELGGRSSGSSSSGSNRGRGRPKGSSGRKSSSSRSDSGKGARSDSAPRPGRRRRKGGTRSEHAEQAVAENPGITASQIAEQLKIKPNYVYRVMGDLLSEGRVTKKGMGYYVPDAGTDAPAEEEAATA